MQNQRQVSSKNFVTRRDINRFNRKGVQAVPKKTETIEKNAVQNEEMVKEMINKREESTKSDLSNS